MTHGWRPGNEWGLAAISRGLGGSGWEVWEGGEHAGLREADALVRQPWGAGGGR